MNAVTTSDLVKKPQTLKDCMAMPEFRNKVALSLPKHCSPDRFVRISLTALTRVPRLAECTQESVFQCLYQLSSLGLEPDGRRAHLIPFRDNKRGITTCSLIVDYKGIVELVRNSKEVSYIAADVVCENDEFDYIKGTGAFLKHKPALKERGKVLCAYSFVKLKDGSEDFDVMNVDDIEKIRRRSRSANDGPWVTDWNEMAKKTIFRRHSKWLPLSPEVRDVVEQDDEALTDNERFAGARPASSLVQVVSQTQVEDVGPEPESTDTPAPEPEKPKKTVAPAAAYALQNEVADSVTEAGFTFDQWQKWADEEFPAVQSGSLSSFEDLSANHAKLFQRGKVGMIAGLTKMFPKEAVV